jgi:type IV secretion system protein VirD4
VGSSGKVTRAGDMLIFVAGRPAIYGRQVLYFQNEDLQTRAKIPIASPTTIPSLPPTNRKASS